jgi:hypothetical protein
MMKRTDELLPGDVLMDARYSTKTIHADLEDNSSVVRATFPVVILSRTERESLITGWSGYYVVDGNGRLGHMYFVSYKMTWVTEC